MKDVVRSLRARDELDLPLPGSGRTRGRWGALAALSRRDVVTGRMAEAHADAVAILDELDGPLVGDGDVWGVWAAEPPKPILTATPTAYGAWSLTGRKPWCSGANSCTHALVTARVNGVAELFSVRLDHSGVTPVPDTWHAVGMAESDSGAVDFVDVPAGRVGTSGQYLDRPGFWHGAIGVAACWYGGALGVADALYARCAAPDPGPHALAHLGAVDAALAAAHFTLDAAAQEIDDDPLDEKGTAMARALRVRAVIEHTVAETLDRVGRALGAGPLCSNADHAKRVADLGTYVRQSHAEVDLEHLGRSAAAARCPW